LRSRSSPPARSTRTPKPRRSILEVDELQARLGEARREGAALVQAVHRAEEAVAVAGVIASHSMALVAPGKATSSVATKPAPPPSSPAPAGQHRAGGPSPGGLRSEAWRRGHVRGLARGTPESSVDVAELDGDGAITREEWRTMLCSPHKIGRSPSRSQSPALSPRAPPSMPPRPGHTTTTAGLGAISGGDFVAQCEERIQHLQNIHAEQMRHLQEHQAYEIEVLRSEMRTLARSAHDAGREPT